MPDLISCQGCGHLLSRDAAAEVAGRWLCPRCAPAAWGERRTQAADAGKRAADVAGAVAGRAAAEAGDLARRAAPVVGRGAALSARGAMIGARAAVRVGLPVLAWIGRNGGRAAWALACLSGAVLLWFAFLPFRVLLVLVRRPGIPATDRQVAFLRDLHRDVGRPCAGFVLRSLSVGQASRLIDRLIRERDSRRR